jgi:threonine/homoserine/homoserine lactone efflux protein
MGAALLQGVVAGLAIAMPLGAVGVLLLHEAINRGWRPAAAAALGVALVDVCYATIAVAATGTVQSLLKGHESVVHRVAAAVLLVIAVHGLLTLWLQRRTEAARGSSGGDSEDAECDDGLGPTSASSGPTAATMTRRFFALTALNPVTALYFAALTTALGSLHDGGVGPAASFVAGVLAGSLAWQLVLTGVGAVAGGRMPPRAKRLVSLVGYLVVLGFAVGLASSSGG